MDKISEYLIHADACRKMAKSATDPAHKEALLRVAQTWTELAHAREQENARRERLRKKDAGLEPVVIKGDG
jgi:hypothetical protein